MCVCAYKLRFLFFDIENLGLVVVAESAFLVLSASQLAAELRVPVRNTHVYVFAEHGNDLGSSKDVKGNPTEFFRRVGHGSSYGLGVKLGLVRAEYAVDHNAGTGAVFFRFGERF